MADSRLTGAYNYKTLLCTDIPELFLDKHVARSHFGRFGTLMNFVLRPRRMTCTVSYATEAEAERALIEGGVYNGHQFHMSYAERESAPAQKTEEWVDPDVQAELSALTAGWRSEYPTQQSKHSGKSSSGLAQAPQASTGAPATASNPSRHNPSLASGRERPSAQFKELEAVMSRPAHTSEEKYRVLDARDKLLRLKRNQKQQLHVQSSVGATQGHCPDMCPEKERLLREFQRQVAVYELQPGSDDRICHERALKQYSRSSADQETPLPHELRTEAALHMTMAYLMHEIMDNSHNLGDWFHFVWDRTRSIRKEITQQELCSLGAVKLVEQCARFHIHCAARLVAEDPSVFDSKINAENLTKCLQTLKYMYHDLRLKGVQCPCEAEFRGYIILLNLGDANFLWDIGQLPADVQGCPEVCQAIEYYLALQDTNFVRFFQLVRAEETSYLSACILITYFTRLRVLALHRLIQSYRAPRKNEVSSLPLPYVSEMLCFGSDQVSAAHFVEHYGLEVNESGRVALTRMHTTEADYKLPRQLELVESKRRQTVGECICGEPLPPRSLYLGHRPHNSFNEHSVLKSIAWSAKDQLPEVQQQQQHHQEEQQHQQELHQNQQQQRQQQLAELQRPQAQNDNFFKVPMQPGGTSAANFTFALPKPRGQELLQLAVEQQQMQRDQEAKHQALQQAIAVAKKREAELMAIHEAKVAEAERVREEKLKKRLEAEAERMREEKLKKEEAERQRQQQEKELKRQRRQWERERQEKLKEERLRKQQERETRLEQQSLDSYQTLFPEILAEICRQELQLHNEACRTIDSMVEEIVRKVAKEEMQKSLYELGIQRKFWQRWRNYRRVQQQKDTLFNQLPLSFAADRPELLMNERSVADSLRMIRRYRQGLACDYGSLLAGREQHSWLKLDLWRVLNECLPQTPPGATRFYKLLLLSNPSHPNGQHLDYDLDMGLLQQPLSQEACVKPEQGIYIRALHQGVALSVVKVNADFHDVRTVKFAEQADSIICLAGVTELSHILPHLGQLIRKSQCPDVAFILQHSGQEWQEPQLPLKDLGVRQARIFPLRQGPCSREHLMKKFEASVRFLAKASVSRKSLATQQLHQSETREFLIAHLGQELFSRLKDAAKQDRAVRRRCQRGPQYCVELYNEAVRRLQLVVGEDLDDCPRFPDDLRVFVDPGTMRGLSTDRQEFFEPGWHDPSRRQRIVQLLELSKLPKMPPLPPMNLVENYCQWVLDYVQLSQQEDLVESIAVQATNLLEEEEASNEVGYFDFVALLANERLQYILHRELELPNGIIFRVNTLKNSFLSGWYYDFQAHLEEDLQAYEQHDGDGDLDKSTDEQEQMEQELEGPNDKLDFQKIMEQAEALLKKRYKRQALRDVTGPSTSKQNTNDSPCKRAAGHKKKRQRLS
ncbi:protein xmas-2 [Drosophila serrata]|uniref:protein xmas-2 n=1 Tax=Drosophila serrata TaxID=7274 RepID=UPI000A1D2BCB|nr:protein xmas-2 [Drosophila serrata]